MAFRGSFSRKPFSRGAGSLFRRIKFQTMRVISVATSVTAQTSRTVNKLLESLRYQTVRFVNIVSFIYQATRTISLWVLPTELKGKFRRQSDDIIGRFQRTDDTDGRLKRK